jgi:hypothetical protein
MGRRIYAVPVLRRCDQAAFRPARTPLTMGSVVPVIQSARLLVRNNIALMTSSG